MNADSWAARLYQSVRNYRTWPQMFKCTPALRHKPLDTDSEIDFYSHMRYLEDLRDAIIEDCRLAKSEAPDIFSSWIAEPLLEACCVPVESAKFWEDFGEWPVDMAKHLLAMWRFDNEMNAWMNGEILA